MDTTATGAKEMHKMFVGDIAKAWYTSGGRSWEENVLDGLRRFSAPFAVELLEQMGLGRETTEPFKLFDNACGPGVVAAQVVNLVKPEVMRQSSILCGDFSELMISIAQNTIEKEGWGAFVKARRVDAQNTGLETGAYTHVTTGFGYHVIPDSNAALDESLRLLKPGGTLGFTTWHLSPGWAADLRAAFKSFPFEAPFEASLQTTEWGDWADANWIRKTLQQEKKLEDVKVEVSAKLLRVHDAQDFVQGFAMVVDWIMKSCWSEELRREHGTDEVHGLIKEYLEKKYGGGGWDLTWVAIIASGRVGL